MKITQEVRDFAAKQNAGIDTFLNSSPLRGEGDHAQHGGGAAPSETDAEAGMAEMSGSTTRTDESFISALMGANTIEAIGV